MASSIAIVVDPGGSTKVLVDGELLGPVEEVFLEHIQGMRPRVKVKLLEVRGGAVTRDVATQANERNRRLLRGVSWVEVFEGSGVPGMPYPASADEKTQV